MMETKINYILVGAFVLIFSTAFIAGILWLGAGAPGAAVKYYLVYTGESVAGLSQDAAVKYRGVDIGRVSDISLDKQNPELVRLMLEVERDTPIKQDTIAVLEMQGLTGLAYINLKGGSRDAPPLEPREGERYPVIESAPSFMGSLDERVPELLSRVIESSERVNAVLSDENQAALRDTLVNLQLLTEQVAGRADRVTSSLDDLAHTMRHSREASERLPRVLAQVERSAKALEGMADEMAATGRAVRTTVHVTSQDVQRFSHEALPEANALLTELRLTAANLRRVSEMLERDPSVLLYGPASPPPGPGE